MCESLTKRHATSPLKRWLFAALAVCAVGVQAQSQVDDPDWQESDAPTPPAFNTEKLIPIEMPPYVTLQFGVDPATLNMTPDGIVRYVVVATNAAGSVNAMFEGIRCGTGEVKTYARASTNGAWSLVKVPQWRGLNDNLPSKHALVLARQGVCDGGAPANSVTDIIKNLKSR